MASSRLTPGPASCPKPECETHMVNVAGFSESGVPGVPLITISANSDYDVGRLKFERAAGWRMSSHRTRRVRRR